MYSFENINQVICVAYTDNFSVCSDSNIDLKIGCEHKIVSSNQIVLNNATEGSLVIVTSESRNFVIGILGKHIKHCALWLNHGGHVFKYAREFTPITNIIHISVIIEKWLATCEVFETSKNPKLLFNSRLCGYGVPYIPALIACLKCGIIPLI
jgi:hypothetical protein